MSVHIIIDGYNLIRQSRSLCAAEQVDLQAGRDALLKRLVAYKRIKRHKITVVFDGVRSYAPLPNRDYVGGIRVQFSRDGETADTVIKRIVAREKEKAVVVSSDRDLIHSAAARGAAVISSPEFEAKMDMAEYMELKGLDAPAEDPAGWQPTTRKKGPRRRLSKKRRKNRGKIKKL